MKKSIEGVEDAAKVEGNKSTFVYECDNGTKGSVKVAVGATENGLVLPHGTRCTVTEDAKSAELEGYTVSVPEAQDVTVQGDETAELDFTNTYKPVVIKNPDQPKPAPDTDGPQSVPKKDEPKKDEPAKQGNKPSPKAPSQGGKVSGKSLAQTGATGALGGLAALSLATGAMMLIARRLRDG